MRAERQAAFAFGVAGIVGVLSTTAVIQLSRMLFSILRSSYNEALRGMHQVAAKINSDSPGGWFWPLKPHALPQAGTYAAIVRLGRQ